MPAMPTDVVTGSFGFIGKYITRQLLDSGRQVKTITGHPDRPDPFDGAVTAHPFNFDKPAALVETLRGCDTLYNTYWIRFDHGDTTFKQAVANSKVMFDSAKEAGVRKIVHVSIIKPSLTDDLPYYRGKAELESYLNGLGMPVSILRPAVVFGQEGILINNIAWTIRKFPVVPVFSSGDYRIEPIFVEDLASLAIESAKGDDNVLMDTVGPESYTYEELLNLVRSILGKRTKIVHIPPWLGLGLGKVIGLLQRDVLLTSDEMDGLMADKLNSEHPPRGWTKLSEWLKENRDTVGTTYMSELARHYR